MNNELTLDNLNKMADKLIEHMPSGTIVDVNLIKKRALADYRSSLIEQIESKKMKNKGLEMPTIENYMIMNAYNQAIDDILKLLEGEE